MKKFVIVEFPFERRLKLLPDTNFVAELRFKGEHALDGGRELPRAAISGLWDTARARIYRGGTGILLVMFTESGASAFLRSPLDALVNTTAAMEHVLDGASELGVLDERLATAKDHTQRVQIAESFLLARVHNNGLDSLVSAAIARLEATEASVRIEELSRLVGLSQSALERRFRRNVGTSPKQFAYWPGQEETRLPIWSSDGRCPMAAHRLRVGRC